MKFRPCIDIHNGSVKQIIGGSLTDSGNQAVDNFISGQNAAFYAKSIGKMGCLEAYYPLEPEGH